MPRNKSTSRKAPSDDPRPKLSRIIKDLEANGGHAWYSWPKPRGRICLESMELSCGARALGWVVFVHRGKFGLGWLFDKDGSKITSGVYIDGTQAPTIYETGSTRAVASIYEGSDKVLRF